VDNTSTITANPDAADYTAHRWATLAASFMASLCCGFGYAWSVLAKPMMESFGWTPSEVSVAFTLLISISACSTLLAGKALRYMHPRTLLLAGGGILGIGVALLGSASTLGLLYTFTIVAGLGGIVYPGATMPNLMRLFPHSKGMASGVLTAGFGLGAVIWSPVAILLVNRFGLAWALRILGAVFFVVIGLCSRFVVTAPSARASEGRMPSTSQEYCPVFASDKNWSAMLRTVTFWALASVFTIGLTSGLMVTGHASPIAQQVLGISAQAAGITASYVAAGMVVGKIGWGFLSDRLGHKGVLIALMLLAIAALALLYRSSTYPAVVIGFFVVGACYGGFLSLIGPVTLDVFGSKNFPINFGIMFMCTAVASYIGPRLAAAAVEANNGEYRSAFLIAGIITVSGLIPVTAYSVIRRMKRPS
jgi:OFA family oxalate/formate antiporter-like MFS transporter